MIPVGIVTIKIILFSNYNDLKIIITAKHDSLYKTNYKINDKLLLLMKYLKQQKQHLFILVIRQQIKLIITGW